MKKINRYEKKNVKKIPEVTTVKTLLYYTKVLNGTKTTTTIKIIILYPHTENPRRFFFIFFIYGVIYRSDIVLIFFILLFCFHQERYNFILFYL